MKVNHYPHLFSQLCVGDVFMDMADTILLKVKTASHKGQIFNSVQLDNGYFSFIEPNEKIIYIPRGELTL